MTFVDSLAGTLVGTETPGLAVLVVRNGRVLHRAGYGATGVDADALPVTPETPFYVASMAKMFTASAVLTLVNDGRLRLDEPIGSYLDIVPEYATGLTIRQLLTHTSGLPDHYDIKGEEPSYSNAEVLEILRQAGGLSFEPGTKWGYSNSAYVLLSALVAEVSGEPFGSFLRHHFFDPLGMNHTRVVAGGTAPEGRAIGFRRIQGSFAPSDYESSTTGDGGVYSTLSDLERWYRALAAGEVLPPETLVLESRPAMLADGRPTPFGMGWLAESAESGVLANHWYVLAFGSLRGFRALFQWYQKDDFLLVWLSNSDSPKVLDTLMVIPQRMISQ